jgi:hypothetical protein
LALTFKGGAEKMQGMYLARKSIRRRIHYFIRQSYPEGEYFKSRDLFDLGQDPARFIVYPGGHGYYYRPEIEERLEEMGVTASQQDLDAIFWEFLDPQIRRVINGFQRPRSRSALRQQAGRTAAGPIHLFDKRRIHYLRFARVDQGDILRLPAKLFSVVNQKSRDEIEQYFLDQEKILRPAERATYIYVIFELARVFEHPETAAGMARLDDYFIERVCRLNADALFWAGMPAASGLQEYLVNYVIMYFDHAFVPRNPFQAYLEDFINRHRDYRPPLSVQVKMQEASELFATPWQDLQQMNRRELIRLYRKQALRYHPDQGGSQQHFVKLTSAYQNLLKRKRKH